MNNCPKCGNPLQVGTTSCPICGTNISNSVRPEQKNDVAKTTVTVASVATPQVQPTVKPAQTAQPTVAPVQVAPTVAQPEAQPVAPAPIATAVPTIEQSQVQQPVAPTPVQEVKVVQEPTPVVQAQPVTQTVTVQPEVKTETPIDPNSIAPTIKPIEVGTPVPSIPASLNPDAPVPTVSVDASVKKEKPKNKLNKTTIVLLGVLAIVVIVAALMMNIGGGTKLNSNVNTNPEKNSSLELTAVSTNGYKFNLEDGWLITEDGTNVIVTNKDETVAIKLDFIKNSLDTISKSTIEGYFNSRQDFTNTEVTETTISAKKAYLVNTQINQAMVQLYYINGGTNLTLGATIVYQSSETKTKYEANVTELIGSLSYADESLKAISSMEMYSNIFGIYNGVFQYQSTPEQPQVNENPGASDTNNENSTETPSNTPSVEETPVVENPTE